MGSSAQYTLNFGPHHPSTHGVLRLVLELSGERIISCEPDTGYLHRDVERLVEGKPFVSIIPYIDRLDYLAPAIQEHAYAMVIESLTDIVPPPRAILVRTIFDELTRISSHIMAIGTSTFDLGCLSLFLYGIEEREKIMDIFEAVTGARMHLAYYIPGGVMRDVPDLIFERIQTFLSGLGEFLLAVEKMALNNRIFAKRTKGVGVISQELAMSSRISGVNLRASGVDYDVRKNSAYGAYSYLDFQPILLDEGDCYARTKLRFLEISQSADLILQCIKIIEPGEICAAEAHHLCALKAKAGATVYMAAETPRGAFGIDLTVGNDGLSPGRICFKSPSFMHVQILRQLLVGQRLSDVTATLGSLDFIMGCCDR